MQNLYCLLVLVLIGVIIYTEVFHERGIVDAVGPGKESRGSENYQWSPFEVMNDWKRFNNVNVTSIVNYDDIDNETTDDKGSVSF